MTESAIRSESPVGVVVEEVSMASSHSVAVPRSVQSRETEEAVLPVLTRLLGRTQEGTASMVKSST